MPANAEMNRTGPANKQFHVRPDESRSDEKTIKSVVVRDASVRAAAVKEVKMSRSQEEVPGF